MKATIALDSLLDGLSVASMAAASRTPKPALQGVLIDVLADTVLLMSTDLEVGVRYELSQVEVERQGQVLVPVAKLSQIIRESNDQTVALELDGDTLHVRYRGSHFQVFSGDPRDFPAVPQIDGHPDFVLPASQLRQVIERTLFAAARESTRYAIDGLLWDIRGDGQLRVVATDGRRLALARTVVQEPQGGALQAIVPAKTMNLLNRVIGDPEEQFQVKFSSNQVMFRCPRGTVSSVLVEGHFPKYEDVIPQDCDRKVRLPVSEMLGAVKRSALLTSEESKAIRLHFADNRLVMTGRAPEQGEASVELAVEYAAEPLEIGFNPAFLLDVLKVLDQAEVDLELKDATRPGMFRNDEDYLYVVMPVNLS